MWISFSFEGEKCFLQLPKPRKVSTDDLKAVNVFKNQKIERVTTELQESSSNLRLSR